MRRVECEYELEVLAAVHQSLWPERVAAELRAHAAECEICREAAAVAGALAGDREELLRDAAIADASRIWRMAQLRARREAVLTAGRPITAVQVIAFACAMGLLGACFGATSAWFRAALDRTTLSLTSFDTAAILASATRLLMAHGAFVLSLVAAVFLIPTVFYMALGRD
jgi:hypothetical protein